MLRLTNSRVLDSKYSSDEEYSDIEVCSEDEQVNNFEYDDEEQAPSFVILSEEEDTFVNEFCSWFKSTGRGEKSACDAEKHRPVLMNTVRFDQEQFKSIAIALFDKSIIHLGIAFAFNPFMHNVVKWPNIF